MDLIKPGNPRRVMLGMCLQMWSQLCGMNIMMYVRRVPMVGSINHPIYSKKKKSKGTTSSTSSKAQVLQDVVVTSSPT